jgi:hypothetical protein
MNEARSFLLDALRRVAAGGELTNDALLSGVPDPQALGPVEKEAWLVLSGWADDDGIRAMDPAYTHMQQGQVAAALVDLEALEAGYDPFEIEMGDHVASRIPLAGCLLGLGLAACLAWLAWNALG